MVIFIIKINHTLELVVGLLRNRGLALIAQMLSVYWDPSLIIFVTADFIEKIK